MAGALPLSRPGLAPGPLSRHLPAGPGSGPGRRKGPGVAVSQGAFHRPLPVIPGLTGDPIHTASCTKRRGVHGRAAAPSPKPRGSGSEWIPGRAGDDAERDWSPSPYRLLPLSPLAGEMSPQGDRGGARPLRSCRRPRPSLRRRPPLCPVPGHLPLQGGERRKGQGLVVSHRGFARTLPVIPGLTGDPIHAAEYTGGPQGHGRSAISLPEPRGSGNEWIPGRAGDDSGEGDRRSAKPRRPAPRNGTAAIPRPRRLFPFSPLEGEMSANADRGGARPLRSIRRLRPSRRAFTPLCPVPGHLPLQGGEGREGKGLVVSHRGFTSTLPVIPGLTGDPIHAAKYTGGPQGHGRSAISLPEPRGSGNEWIPGRAGDDSGEGGRRSATPRRPAPRNGTPSAPVACRPRLGAGAARRGGQPFRLDRVLQEPRP
jgi:hypothetical protein